MSINPIKNINNRADQRLNQSPTWQTNAFLEITYKVWQRVTRASLGDSKVAALPGVSPN